MSFDGTHLEFITSHVLRSTALKGQETTFQIITSASNYPVVTVVLAQEHHAINILLPIMQHIFSLVIYYIFAYRIGSVEVETWFLDSSLLLFFCTLCTTD